VGILTNKCGVWVFPSGMIGLIPELVLSEVEYDMAPAIHGPAVVLNDFAPNRTLDAEILSSSKVTHSGKRSFREPV
jgi:hypothetical protein